MVEGPKEGLNAALTKAMDQVGDLAPGEKVEQLALLPLPLDEDEEATKADRRGRGRPLGAKNKRTEEWTNYLLSNYRSPLEALAQIASARVEDLARRLGCKRVEAFKLQIQAAKELAPYLHQKQPTAIDLGDAAAFNLTINAAAPGGQGQALPGDDAVVIKGQLIDPENDDKSEG